MKDIHISPLAQLLTLLGVIGIVLGAMAAQAPEIKRYLKIKAM